MKLSRTFGQALIVKASFCWILAHLAGAYIQPGTSSFLIKILVSSLVAIVLVLRGAWRTIRLLFLKPTVEETIQESTDEPGTISLGSEKIDDG